MCRRRQWHPTPVLLPGKSHGWRSLVGYRPWGRWESDTTERLHFHFSLLCIGEGNGNPLQSSCLENPRDRGALWAAIYGVAQSRTRLKRLSSSTSMQICIILAWLSHPGMPDMGGVLRKRDDLGHVTDIHSISPTTPSQLYTQGTEERIPDTFSLNHCLKTLCLGIKIWNSQL